MPQSGELAAAGGAGASASATPSSQLPDDAMVGRAVYVYFGDIDARYKEAFAQTNGTRLMTLEAAIPTLKYHLAAFNTVAADAQVMMKLFVISSPDHATISIRKPDSEWTIAQVKTNNVIDVQRSRWLVKVQLGPDDYKAVCWNPYRDPPIVNVGMISGRQEASMKDCDR